MTALSTNYLTINNSIDWSTGLYKVLKADNSLA